jgi:protein-export membrane protein SecD
VLHYARWKIITITGSILLALLLSIPNILPTATQEVWKNYGLRPMTLGLDLQGGANLLLEVDKVKLKEDLNRQLPSDVRGSLRDAKIAYSDIVRGQNSVSLKITKPEDMAAAKEKLNGLLQPQQGNILLGAAGVNLYDLQTNADGYTLKLNDKGFDAKVQAAVKQSLTIIEKRINITGTTEPTIQQQGTDRIAVQVPGLGDSKKILDIVKTTAKLDFQLVCEEQPQSPTQTPPTECRAYPQKAAYDVALKKKQATDPAVTKLSDEEKRSLPSQMWVQTSNRAIVSGADISDASSSFDQSNRPVVTFRFNQKGAVRFGNLTRDNVNKPFAIVLDGVVQSAPNINEPILGGSGQISGNFTTEETGALAVVLKSGALPAELIPIEERTVGPSLGADSVKAGFLACVIGVLAVMAFMLLPYGFFGWVANAALMANLLLLVASMSFFGFTLTLPGIAGILLTLGMAVDSNVLIYERIREEWRNGRTALSSIETGFKSALGTVLDANVTTLIAAVVLFGVGSGPVRGFAVTLAIGIFTTMFTAFTVTRMLVSIWVKRRRPKEINL